MALDDATLAGIRSWVGSSPSDEDLGARHGRLGSGDLVALEVLRGRLADALSSPATISIEGDYSESRVANISTLRDQVRQLEAITGTGPAVVTVGQLVRIGRAR